MHGAGMPPSPSSARHGGSLLLIRGQTLVEGVTPVRRGCNILVAKRGPKKNAPEGVFVDAAEYYLAFIRATVVSSMRFEKPHSLSYHDDTFTSRPETLVRVESKFDEAGLWLKSIDTSGSVW